MVKADPDVPAARRGLAWLLALLPALPRPAAADDLPCMAEALPPLPLRPAWEAAGGRSW